MDLTGIIVALASPPGRSARAIVRASGAGVLDALAGVATIVDAAKADDRGRDVGDLPRGSWPIEFALPPSHRDVDGPVRLPCTALVLRGPRSFTGEDTVELVVPGHPALVARVVDRLIDAAAAAGHAARRAEPGAFSFRAWTNGRLELDDAERLAAMIAARSEAGLAAAEALAAEPVADAARRASGQLADLLAVVEAGIDFTDEEDVVAIPAGDLVGRLESIRCALDDERARTALAADEDALPWVVLAGPPNAGKSTLFNALLERERAIVSDVAGTTRDVLFEVLHVASGGPAGDAAEPIACLLVDRAGDDAHAVGADAGGQRLGAGALERAALVLACRPPGGAFEGSPHDVRTLRVRTQVDRAGARDARRADDADDADVATSARTGAGLDELRRAIGRCLAAREDDASATRALVRPRHRAGLEAASAAIGAAIEAASGAAADGGSAGPARRALAAPELVAHALRTALDELAILAGAVDADDVLGRIFATFCVGK